MLYNKIRYSVIDWWRKNVTKLLTPLFKIFEIIKLTPNHLTLIGLLFGLIGVYFFYINNQLLFIIFILLHILFDVLDGNYARYLENWKDKGRYLDFGVDTGLVLVLLAVIYLKLNIPLILITIIFYIIHHLWYLVSKLKSAWVPTRTLFFLALILTLTLTGIWVVLLLSIFGIVLQVIELIKQT